MPLGSVIVDALSFRTDQAEVAYRAADEGMYLKKILCFKYRLSRALQLLSGTDRPIQQYAADHVFQVRQPNTSESG